MTLSRTEVESMRALGRRAVEQLAGAATRQGTGFSRSFAKVTKVYGDGRLDVDGGTEGYPMPMKGLRSTTACQGARVGDVAVVDTYAHTPLVTGLIATSDTLNR